MESSESIIEAFRTYCKSRNVRQSSIKVKVLLRLWFAPVCKSADILFIELKNAGDRCTIASVYNALNWLTEEGFLIKETSLRKAVYCCHKTEVMVMLNLERKQVYY